MAKTIGYLITWTSYGTWLQGDKRGYVKDGQVLQGNERLFKDNEQKLCKDSVHFGLKERKAEQQAIEEEAKKHNLRLYAIKAFLQTIHMP